METEEIVCLANRAAIIVAIPMPPRVSGSPVTAGFSPILPIILSIFRAARANPTTKIPQGNTITPVGITDIADRISFKNTTFITIINSIETYIRIYPVKISFVDLLPPIAKPTGANNVKIATMTYRSPISRNNFTSCMPKSRPMMITSIQPESKSPKKVSSGSFRLICVGMPSSSITFLEIPIPISHICREKTNKNPKIPVRTSKTAGSSPSNPSPENMDFIA